MVTFRKKLSALLGIVLLLNLALTPYAAASAGHSKSWYLSLPSLGKRATWGMALVSGIAGLSLWYAYRSYIKKTTPQQSISEADIRQNPVHDLLKDAQQRHAGLIALNRWITTNASVAPAEWGHFQHRFLTQAQPLLGQEHFQLLEEICAQLGNNPVADVPQLKQILNDVIHAYAELIEERQKALRKLNQKDGV